ncbi:MAG: tetratricopeptide repeat protein [Myxococcota bacterium]|nr:tetratricopeptide repeat protein [Myxococcota bacterium]
MAIDREKILVAAQKYVEKKKYDRAVAEYQKVIQEDPNDARTLLKIGDLQSKMEAYADSVATYERVGRFYASQGFSLKAIAVYKQIREIISKHLPQLEDRYAHVTPKLADLYQQLGLTSDALAALDEVATRLQRQGKDQDAIEVFRKIVELDPTNPLPHLRLAEALSHAKDSDGAVTEFGLAAGQLAKLGRRDDSLKVIERLLHHKPEPTHARIAAELYLARSGPNDGLQALAKLQICFQSNPRDLDTLGLLARAFNHIGQAAKAIEVHKEMARIARDTGRTELFKEIIERLSNLVPNDETVRQLAAGSQPPGPRSASDAPARDHSTREDDGFEDAYEDVVDGDIEEADQPLELSRRRPGTSDDGEVVVIESSVEADDVPDHPRAPDEDVSRTMNDAASYRRARLHAEAVEVLRSGLRVVPRSIELHEMLRDVLLEANREGEAATCMIALAELQIEAREVDHAMRTLQEVLAVEPRDARALQMLHALGYEVVEEMARSKEGALEPRGEPAPRLPDYANYDPEGPLPSYDLEDVAALDATGRVTYSLPQERPAVPNPPQIDRRRGIGEIDDPFQDGPLPSFPLPDSETALGSPAEQARRPRSVTPAGVPELEAALEEAEFFASRGLYDDARAILDEQMARLPNHPLVLERLQELDEQEQAVEAQSGARPSPAAEVLEDRAFDIAESLGSIDGVDRNLSVGAEPSVSTAVQQVDVEEVFAKFKEGVAKQIGVDDAQSHYDLGVAYKEMALLDDAMREFETAARDARRACVCHSMIGTIQMERGNVNEAIEAFLRALQAPDHTKDQEASLSYELGSAFEAKRLTKQALEYFQRAARLVPAFRDVQERIRRLQRVEPKASARAVAVGSDDEFDRAFNDIFSGSKLP